jgi:hypothetical protein
MSVSASLGQALADLGRRFGVDDLQPDGYGGICLALADDLKLEAQPTDNELLIVLSRAVPFADGNVLLGLLQRCDRHQVLEWVPQLGLVGMGAECDLLMIERLPLARISGDSLWRSFERLSEWMQGAQELA